MNGRAKQNFVLLAMSRCFWLLTFSGRSGKHMLYASSNAIELRSMQINDGIRIKRRDEAA
jgi:hypothetical protein